MDNVPVDNKAYLKWANETIDRITRSAEEHERISRAIKMDLLLMKARMRDWCKEMGRG